MLSNCVCGVVAWLKIKGAQKSKTFCTVRILEVAYESRGLGRAPRLNGRAGARSKGAKIPVHT